MSKAFTDVLICNMATDATPEERALLAERYGAYPDPDVDEETKEAREHFAFGNCRRFNDFVRGILETTAIDVSPAGEPLNAASGRDAKPKRARRRRKSDAAPRR